MLSVTYGGSYSRITAIVGDATTEMTVHLKSAPTTKASSTKHDVPSPVKVGQDAPPLILAGWTDGKVRSLVDYRGKVVVLDFWGVWCSACINALPVMKNLRTKYAGRDVVFLSIHSAGTELEQVREFQRQEKWEPLTGLDRGDAVAEGATANAYGVQGYPTLLVVGRDGRVAWSSDVNEKEGMQMIERAAKTLSIPWPIDEKKTPKRKLVEYMGRLWEFLFDEAIDRALSNP